MKKKKKVNLREIFLGLQGQMSARLTLNRRILTHPVAKGDASELEWVEMLNTYLPKRYQAGKAFVIDHKGSVSDQIDIVIFDRQFSPFLLRQNGATYVPAESVYAVIEVKPRLAASTLRYAAAKAMSVRKLDRTSARIVHAGGVIERPKKPFEILGGILTLNGSLSGSALQTLKSLKGRQQVHFGCSLGTGAFSVEYESGKERVLKSGADDGLVTFFLDLVGRLQQLGTVPAMDVGRYISRIRR